VETDRFNRQHKTTMLHLAMEAEEVMLRVSTLPDRCKSMAYFDTLLLNFSKGILPGDEKKKRLGTMCVQVPDELIYGVGAIPVRLCDGAYAYDQVGAEFMPAKSCPLTRATLGKLHINRQHWLKTLDGIIIPTTCDQKRKVAEQLETMGYRIYRLEMPATKESELAISYWQESINLFADELQNITGKKLTKKNLRRAINNNSEASRLFRLLQTYRQAEKPFLYGIDLFIVMNCYFIDDLESWQEAATTLLAELESRKEKDLFVGNPKAPRILFTGSPAIFPNLKIPLLIEESGGIIVGDESCGTSRMIYDNIAYDEPNYYDMLPAIADRYLKPCTCPCLSPNDDRGRKIQELIETCKADGVVYQSFSGCLPYELEQKPISDLMSKNGSPMLYVETDYSPEDVGQLSTRIEAFMESIHNRKRKRQ